MVYFDLFILILKVSNLHVCSLARQQNIAITHCVAIFYVLKYLGVHISIFAGARMKKAWTLSWAGKMEEIKM